MADQKAELAKYSRKEGGGLAARDYTDDLYKANVNENDFILERDSTMFTNLLVVVPAAKKEGFEDEILKLLPDYYEYLDDSEKKRFPEMLKY